MATKLSDEYNKATLIIATTFLKNGLDVTLEREDSSGSDEPAIRDGNLVKLNDNLFILTIASLDDPTKIYDVSLNSIVPDYGSSNIDEWELNVEDSVSLRETRDKIDGLSKDILEVREYGLDDINHTEPRSSVKLISNVNKLENTAEFV